MMGVSITTVTNQLKPTQLPWQHDPKMLNELTVANPVIWLVPYARELLDIDWRNKMSVAQYSDLIGHMVTDLE